MNRVITVKGTGNSSVKPDLVIITIELESHLMDYDKTMKLAAKSISELQDAIKEIGFDKKDLKTSRFNVRTDYSSYRDKDDNYKSKFNGYVCEQTVKLEFDLDTKLMSKVLTVISKLSVEPEFNIRFSVKNKEEISEELLISATNNARKKAEILTKASGVTLGDLINIDYNWGELHLYSPTRYDMRDSAMVMSSCEDSYAPDIEPEDIDTSDTVSFMWEIKG